MQPLTDEALARLEDQLKHGVMTFSALDLRDLIAELRRLRAEVEALREDKERLDWLLDNEPSIPSCRAMIDISRAAEREEK